MQTSQNAIHVVFSADGNYTPYLAVSIRTLMDYANPQRQYVVHVLTDSSSATQAPRVQEMVRGSNVDVEFINMEQYTDILKDFHVENRFSFAAYYRLFISEVCPSLSRVIYLDCDLIIHSDLCELADMDFDNNLVIAVKDLPISSFDDPWINSARDYIHGLGMKNPQDCFNSGVLAMNLDAIRAENLVPTFCEVAARNKKYWHDQTVLNICCQGRVKWVGEEWNHTIHMYDANSWDLNDEAAALGRRIHREDNARVIHFATPDKPWRCHTTPYADLWWKAAKRTPFFAEICHRVRRRHTIVSPMRQYLFLSLLCLAGLLIPSARIREKRDAKIGYLHISESTGKDWLRYWAGL